VVCGFFVFVAAAIEELHSISMAISGRNVLIERGQEERERERSE